MEGQFEDGTCCTIKSVTIVRFFDPIRFGWAEYIEVTAVLSEQLEGIAIKVDCSE